MLGKSPLFPGMFPTQHACCWVFPFDVYMPTVTSILTVWIWRMVKWHSLFDSGDGVRGSGMANTSHSVLLFIEHRVQSWSDPVLLRYQLYGAGKGTPIKKLGSCELVVRACQPPMYATKRKLAILLNLTWIINHRPPLQSIIGFDIITEDRYGKISLWKTDGNLRGAEKGMASPITDTYFCGLMIRSQFHQT